MVPWALQGVLVGSEGTAKEGRMALAPIPPTTKRSITNTTQRNRRRSRVGGPRTIMSSNTFLQAGALHPAYLFLGFPSLACIAVPLTSSPAQCLVNSPRVRQTCPLQHGWEPDRDSGGARGRGEVGTTSVIVHSRHVLRGARLKRHLSLPWCVTMPLGSPTWSACYPWPSSLGWPLIFPSSWQQSRYVGES